MERRKRVLTSDSDEQVLISLERLLENEGIKTVTTWSAQQALELLDGQCFDLLFIGDNSADLALEQI